MANRYCSNCGQELNEDSRFCPSCGRPAHETAQVSTPEADVSVPPSPQQQGWGTATPPTQQAGAPTQGRSTTSKLLIGCAAVFGVLVLFVGCLAVLAGGGGDQQTAGSGGGEEAESQPGATKANAVSIGDPVKAGPVEWTVIDARTATTLKGSFGSRKQGDFVIVDFNFTNNKNEATTLDSESFRLIDSEGRQFEVDTDTYEFVPAGKDIFLDQVNPGVSKQGQVIFTVAPGASGFTLQAGDTDMFADENAYIDLGF